MNERYKPSAQVHRFGNISKTVAITTYIAKAPLLRSRRQQYIVIILVKEIEQRNLPIVFRITIVALSCHYDMVDHTYRQSIAGGTDAIRQIIVLG